MGEEQEEEEEEEEEDQEVEEEQVEQQQIEEQINSDNEDDQEEEEQQQYQQQQQQEQEESVPTIKELLEFIYNELYKNKEALNDFIVTICTLWPINASYPIHFGAMIQMVIEDTSKSDLYGFIINNKHYNILQSELSKYSGTNLVGHIKQMANLCNTVGADKFSLLSLNILDAFKTVLNGGKFELDFGPLLKQTTPKKTKRKKDFGPLLKQSTQNDETASVGSYSAKLDAKSAKQSKNKKQKSKQKQKSKP